MNREKEQEPRNRQFDFGNPDLEEIVDHIDLLLSKYGNQLGRDLYELQKKCWKFHVKTFPVSKIHFRSLFLKMTDNPRYKTMTVKEIAQAENLNVRTVYNYLAEIYQYKPKDGKKKNGKRISGAKFFLMRPRKEHKIEK